VSIQRTYRCDAEGCPHHVVTEQRHPPTMLVINEAFFTGPDESTELHFCGWDCVLRFAARLEPTEVIPMNDEEEDPR
jgi:hypothetical protein